MFHSISCIFPAYIPAQKKAWLLGDEFLRIAFDEYGCLHRKAIQDRQPHPYLFANYNIKELHAPNPSNIRAFLARVFNALVRGLNHKLEPLLPRYILIMLDIDLIQHAEVFDYGVSRTFEDTLKWLLININAVVETRKEDLMGKRPGAVSSSMEPRLIWVAAVHHPESSAHRQVHSLIRKFNTILEEVIAGDKRSHILRPAVEDSATNFNQWGSFTAFGLTALWQSIDSKMKRFEHGNTELQPSRLQAHSKTQGHHANNQYHHNSKHRWFKPGYSYRN